jgi:hypothetical protein
MSFAGSFVMPIALPPSLVVAAASPSTDQALGPHNPLAAAYQQAVQALGVHCVGASVVTVDGPLPVGLQAFLDRHNPALAQAALGTSDAPRRFVTTNDRILAGELETSDRQVLGWLVQTQLLARMPTYAVDDVGANGGLTRTEAGFPELTRIAVDANLLPVFRLDELGLQNRVDPVLFRWLVLLHEAGHAQMGSDSIPFDLAGLSANDRALINQVMRGPASVDDSFTSVFKESYADAFAVLSLLRLTHGSAAAWQTVEALREVRARGGETASAKNIFNADSTSAALDRLCVDLFQHPDRLAALQAATPDQVHTWASRYASWGARQWAQQWEAGHPLSPVFAMGWVAPSVEGIPADRLEQITRDFFTIQSDKVNTYARQRVVAYLQAGSQGAVQAPQTDGDPLLEVLARNDASLRAAFEQAQGDPHHAKAALLLRTPIFTGANAILIEATFDQFPEVKAVMDLVRTQTGLLLDDPAFVTQESQFQVSRVEHARAALMRPLPTDELWAVPPSPVASTVTPRRRRF